MKKPNEPRTTVVSTARGRKAKPNRGLKSLKYTRPSDENAKRNPFLSGQSRYGNDYTDASTRVLHDR